EELLFLIGNKISYCLISRVLNNSTRDNVLNLIYFFFYLFCCVNSIWYCLTCQIKFKKVIPGLLTFNSIKCIFASSFKAKSNAISLKSSSYKDEKVDV